MRSKRSLPVIAIVSMIFACESCGSANDANGGEAVGSNLSSHITSAIAGVGQRGSRSGDAASRSGRGRTPENQQQTERSAQGKAARDAAAILADIAKLKPPAFDPTKGSDEEYVQAYLAATEEVESQQAALILELFENHADHSKLSELMPTRWAWLTKSKKFQTVYDETDAILERASKSTLVTEAANSRAVALGVEHNHSVKLYLPAVERFADIAPQDPRLAPMLLRAAQYGTEDPALRRKLYERILSDYPESFYARSVPGKLRQLDGIGKPFELSFVEARSGEAISMSDLRGKVVVIDFWATWCGPCIAAMPDLKELYARYKDQGVEFIGVSLDLSQERGGLDQLRAFCEEQQISWPQYYQGDKYDSGFSASWGINSIPAVFVVDRAGNLFSVDARDKLDRMIPELLAARD